MSSLIAHTDSSQIFVATDTLAVLPGGKPLLFTTKAHPVPHLKMILAGTGSGGFLDEWFVQLNSRMIVAGVENLDYHAPARLRALWKDFIAGKDNAPQSITTTVYHFGFSEQSGSVKGFAYRSADNFVSEPLVYGLRVKPVIPVSPDYKFPEDVTGMMRKQCETQAALPSGERVYIGGEIQVHYLNKDGFRIYTLDRFEDYEAVLTAMLASCTPDVVSNF